MSCYLAYRLSRRIPDTTFDELAAFVPLPGSKQHSWVSKDQLRGLIRFDWENASVTEDFAAFGLPDRPLSRAETGKSLRSMQGGFAYVSVDGPILAYRSWTTEHPVYYRETLGGIFISNRIALLLALGDAQINWNAALDLIGHGYLLSDDTLFGGIYRLKPGSFIPASSVLQIDNAELSEFFTPIKPSDVIAEVISISARIAASISAIKQPLILPLSGGKDSRAIAAIMARSGVLAKASTVYTRGNLYTPDVLAAQGVASMLGIANHTINRPPYIPKATDLASSLVGVIQASEGTLSLYDRPTIGPSTSISIDGHELNLKKSYFDGAPASGFDNIVKYFHSKKPMDPNAVLSQHGRDIAFERFKSLIRGMVEAGVPEHKLPEAFMWLARAHSWVGTMAGTTNIGKTSYNPLMRRDILTLGFRLPLEARTEHLLSYLMMATGGGKPVWNLPFANDTWPDGLSQMLKQLGWAGAMPEMQPPFTSHRSFPSGANPFLSNVNAETTKAMRGFSADILSDTVLGPYFDISAIRSRLTPSAALSVGRMVTELGLAAIALIHRFGRDLFKPSNRAAIAGELSQYFSSSNSDSATQDVQSLQTLLDVHEQSIADLMKELRTMPRARAEKEAVWRHIDISNLTGADLTYQVVMNGNKHGQKALKADASFTYGVMETGKFELFVDGIVFCEIEIAKDRSTYDARILASGSPSRLSRPIR